MYHTNLNPLSNFLQRMYKSSTPSSAYCTSSLSNRVDSSIKLINSHRSSRPLKVRPLRFPKYIFRTKATGGGCSSVRRVAVVAGASYLFPLRRCAYLAEIMESYDWEWEWECWKGKNAMICICLMYLEIWM